MSERDVTSFGAGEPAESPVTPVGASIEEPDRRENGGDPRAPRERNRLIVKPFPEDAITIAVRVRYFETDQMGVAHHANYPVWFEAVRSEICRVRGIDYIAMEATGLALPVVELRVRYLQPARYDDELNVCGSVIDCRRSLVRTHYKVQRGSLLLAEGETVQMLIERATGRPRSLGKEIETRFLGGLKQ